MSFDLSRPVWRVYISQTGCFDFWFRVSGPRKQALKEASNELQARKKRGLQQHGSIWRDGKATLEHPAHGIDTFVRVDKWN